MLKVGAYKMPQARTISSNQARSFLAFLSTRKNAKRNAAAFALSYYAGMRVGEIASLKASDVMTSNKSVKDALYLSSEMTKGNKGREVFLNKTAKHYVAELLKSAHFEPHFPLIQTMGKRKHFTPNSLSILFTNLYRDAGLEGCSSHTGRRSFCSNLANSGVGIRVIQKLSGHRSLLSVQPYLDANEDMVKAAVELVK